MTLTSSEFADWLDYWRGDPWGEQRADLRMGIMAAVYANCHRSRKDKAAKPSDFMPEFLPKDEPKADSVQTVPQQQHIAIRIHEAAKQSKR